MPIYPNFYQTLSACPIVELRGYAAACGLKGRLYAYLDFAGPHRHGPGRPCRRDAGPCH